MTIEKSSKQNPKPDNPNPETVIFKYKVNGKFRFQRFATSAGRPIETCLKDAKEYRNGLLQMIATSKIDDDQS